MDTFLVIGDAHNLIRLQDPGGAVSFVHEVHWLPVIIGFEAMVIENDASTLLPQIDP
jgi:hypothetical protein